MTRNLAGYKRQHRNRSVTKDIRDRWAMRITPNNHHMTGRAGANVYLQLYGRNIGSQKCIKFAVYATSQGYSDFAEVFWEKAFRIDHPGIPLHSSDQPPPTGSAVDLPDIFNT